jgi:thiamine pyrophosphokinase
LSNVVTGITYTGMRYPLEDATLHLGSTRGISNEVSAVPATVTIATGRLLLIQTLA